MHFVNGIIQHQFEYPAAILFIYDSKTFAQPCQVAGPGPIQVQVQVQGPQKVAGLDLDQTLDSLAEHPSILTNMANLASTYQKQGRWNEAEQLEVQVMNTRQ